MYAYMGLRESLQVLISLAIGISFAKVLIHIRSTHSSTFNARSLLYEREME